ncbi:ROK family transcriptional regulator [Bacillus litorisediminis]|uniref:ROK family transcriptional regulator n=1 Tax=Bacillus litorisediminis TaxID=2922713 RepID=UPI001FAEF8C2|nr:ROK family transcriptional regulator [Bacillus litorisediminis]
MRAVANNKASPKLVKQMNRQMILSELKSNPRQSRADLAKQTKLSRPCVSELVKEMIDEGLIIEVGPGASTGGKRPILLEYNVKSNFVIGAMIANSRLSVILADMQGEWIDLVHRDFTIPTDGYFIVQLIEQTVRKLLAEQHISSEDVLGMAIGIPGITSKTQQKIGFSPGVDWDQVNLVAELSDRLSIQVVVDNDVNMMTLGEYHRGFGVNVTNLVYMFVGHGVGSGIILDGKFHKGSHSAAGEIGLMRLGNDQKKSASMGVFESNYGLLGIQEKLQESGLSAQQNQSLLDYLQQAEASNKTARSILHEVIDHWAAAVINLSSILDPQMIILSGEMAMLNEKSFKQFTRIIESYLPETPEIRVTTLGSKAGLHGAVHLALESFSQAGLMNKNGLHM